MEPLDIARLQFGATTVYHFFFVPLTLGIAPLVAILQTLWLRTDDVRWYRLTKFFGKLMLINFSIGVVTGIVQEFQFGMNWSGYSRFVGDVFGAPLAIEGLAAFFLESTFLGLWIFGWDKLPRKVHLACVWLFAIGTWLSAYFIIAANSFMQHPVAAKFNPESGRAELHDLGALLTNPTTLAAFPHVIGGALLTGSTFVAGIAIWWMVKAQQEGDEATAKTFRKGARVALWFTVIAGIATVASGDVQAKMMFDQQPIKMSAAEAVCETERGASFSILSIGDLNNNCEEIKHVIAIPNLTSILADGDPNAEIKSLGDLQKMYEEKYGAVHESGPLKGEKIDYLPNIGVTYWSFRLMIGFAAGSAALALAGLWFTRGDRVPDMKWLKTLALIAIPTPFLANAFGWIFTEMGRQPWIVAPNPDALSGTDGVWMLVVNGVSNHPAWVVWTSLTVFTLVYGAGMVVWFKLLRDYVQEGLPTNEPEKVKDNDDDSPMSFAY